MEFLLWRNETQDGYCTVKMPVVERVWELTKGVSRAQDLSNGIECKMNPLRPKDIGLSDNIRGAGFPIVSKRLKEALQNEVRNNRVEYLPARIINHKGRLASDEYFVLNPLDVIDVIDKDASGVEWNKISPDSISYCKGLVLNGALIPPGFNLFRPKHWENNILIDAAVAATLRQLNLTGLVFRIATGYNGIG